MELFLRWAANCFGVVAALMPAAVSDKHDDARCNVDNPTIRCHSEEDGLYVSYLCAARIENGSLLFVQSQRRKTNRGQLRAPVRGRRQAALSSEWMVNKSIWFMHVYRLRYIENKKVTWSNNFLLTKRVLSGLASCRARKVNRQPTWEGVKSELSTMTWQKHTRAHTFH